MKGDWKLNDVLNATKHGFRELSTRESDLNLEAILCMKYWRCSSVRAKLPTKKKKKKKVPLG